ncbi:uncharacterized protein CLUP02_01415 [Colletotrichum lupini]|uniref:Uncharacterized protein n=1 Tax=Colletotrichum lupini TaxID=145971 RepID=A0A9Q8SCX1_9PEZI|nr:uncharacterized protein CLUP02_01415 [Colletotrichum lupini]UQC74763.1 hypothetical protein CLUP02_01415 [Colletotrichum lupini]
MWNDADAEEDAHQTASSRVVPPYHASFISSGQRTRSLVSGLEEPPTAVSRIRGSFCPVGGRLSSGLFSLPVLSDPTAATSEDPFPHLMQRQAMTYLRQLKSTFPLGPWTECNLVARRTAAYRSVWGHRVIGCRPANSLALANQSVMSLPLMNVGQYPYRYSKPIPSHVHELPVVSACNGDGGTWLSLGDQNVKRENCDEIGTNPQYSPEVHRPWVTLGSEQGRTSAPGSQSDSQNAITLCLGLFNPLVVSFSSSSDTCSIAGDHLNNSFHLDSAGEVGDTSFQAGLMALRRRPASDRLTWARRSERGNRVYRSPAGRRPMTDQEQPAEEEANAVEPHLRRAMIREKHQGSRKRTKKHASNSGQMQGPLFRVRSLVALQILLLDSSPLFCRAKPAEDKKKTASERGSRWSFSSVDVSASHDASRGKIERETVLRVLLLKKRGHQTIAWTVLETWAIFGFLQSPHRISIRRRNPHVSWNPLSSVRIRDTNANLVVPNLGQDAAAAKPRVPGSSTNGPLLAPSAFLPLLLGEDAAPPPLQVRQASGRPNSPGDPLQWVSVGVCQAKSLRHLNILCGPAHRACWMIPGSRGPHQGRSYWYCSLCMGLRARVPTDCRATYWPLDLPGPCPQPQTDPSCIIEGNSSGELGALFSKGTSPPFAVCFVFAYLPKTMELLLSGARRDDGHVTGCGHYEVGAPVAQPSSQG